MSLRRIRRVVLIFSPLMGSLALWQYYVSGNARLQFLFGSPCAIAEVASRELRTGSFYADLGTTAIEATLGLALGVISGVVIAIALFYEKALFQGSKPYVVAAAAVPIFTLAPVLIIWFGTGVLARVAMTAGAVVFFAIADTWKILSGAERRHGDWLRGLGVNRAAALRHVYLGEALRLSSGTAQQAVPIAMAGCFVAEFVVSQEGLGRFILAAGGLYDIPKVFFGLVCFMLLTLVLRAILSSIALLWG